MTKIFGYIISPNFNVQFNREVVFFDLFTNKYLFLASEYKSKQTLVIYHEIYFFEITRHRNRIEFIYDPLPW